MKGTPKNWQKRREQRKWRGLPEGSSDNEFTKIMTLLCGFNARFVDVWGAQQSAGGREVPYYAVDIA